MRGFIVLTDAPEAVNVKELAAHVLAYQPSLSLFSSKNSVSRMGFQVYIRSTPVAGARRRRVPSGGTPVSLIFLKSKALTDV
jgi:hypothetical protein